MKASNECYQPELSIGYFICATLADASGTQFWQMSLIGDSERCFCQATEIGDFDRCLYHATRMSGFIR